MISFVLDASVAASWLFEDQADAESDAALSLLADGSALVPVLFVWETVNVCLTAERRGLLTRAKSSAFLEYLHSLPITLDAESPRAGMAGLLQLAQRHGLSAYDAAYLDLALRSGSPLATKDARLRRAADAEGVGGIPAAITTPTIPNPPTTPWRSP